MLTERIHKKTGFTLVELLVVISIIALLLAILMPSLQKAREQGRKVVCMSDFKQLGLGLFMYSNDNKGRWPSKFNVPASDPLASMNGTPIIYYSSWQLALGDKNNPDNTTVTSFQSRLRPAFLDLLTPSYISNYKVYFCPGASKNKSLYPPLVAWNYTISGRGQNIVAGQWTYQSYWIDRSAKAKGMTQQELFQSSFQSLWAAGVSGQKGLKPLFSDLYYVYSNNNKPVPQMTWHMDGESLLFTDGHVDFIKTNSEWFAPFQVDPSFR
jgi:prepilin-type N-terminal cleavage/methylation domain-containing protein